MRALVAVFICLCVFPFANAQDLFNSTDGLFFCRPGHPRCGIQDQNQYGYHQFAGRHVGQYSGVSDLLSNGPPIEHYQTWLSEIITQRPNTNVVASWSDAMSVVDGGRVWGGFTSARSFFGGTVGSDSQLIGLEIDVLNAGKPGVYPNASKVGLQIVGFGALNTNAIEVVAEGPNSGQWLNVINVQAGAVAPFGTIFGITPQKAAIGLNLQGSEFSDSAMILSPNAKISFRSEGVNDAAIYRDQFSNGYLVLQAGTPGLRITDASNSKNLAIITPDGDIITPLGSLSTIIQRLEALESRVGLRN